MLEMRAINGVLSTMVGYHTHIHILIQTLSVYEVGSNVKPFKLLHIRLKEAIKDILGDT